MPLARAIQNSRHTGQRVTFEREDGSGVVDLTNVQTITCRIRNESTGATMNGDGSYTPASPLTGGQFDWAYGAAEVATAGNRYLVQFIVTFLDGSVERSILEQWSVLEAI
jgi:hypothetical protein